MTKVNNVIGVINYVIAARPSLLNFMTADRQPGEYATFLPPPWLLPGELGMFRGGSEILNRSVKQLAPVVELISREPREIREPDANDYSAEGCKALIATAGELQESLKVPAR
jgi:hypothetical protein